MSATASPVTISSPGAPLPAYEHVFLVKADFDAATATHNYDVTSTYPGDGSAFKANCVKCHNDKMTKSYQNSTERVRYPRLRLLEDPCPARASERPTDPLEEEFCYPVPLDDLESECGIQPRLSTVFRDMANQEALEIEGAFSRTYTHPTQDYSGRHKMQRRGGRSRRWQPARGVLRLPQSPCRAAGNARRFLEPGLQRAEGGLGCGADLLAGRA